MKKSEFLVFILILTLYNNSNQSGFFEDDINSDTVVNLNRSDNDDGNYGNENKVDDGIYLLGFGRYKKENNRITFRIYFKPNLEYYMEEYLKFNLIINYLNSLRALEEEKEEVTAFCRKANGEDEDNDYDIIIKFDCEAFTTKDKSIKSIISKRDYSYSGSRPVHFVESSNSINANIAEETEDYLGNKLFLLKDGILMKDKNAFTIEGKIEEDFDNIAFSEENVTLILNDAEDRKKIPCGVENLSDEYYNIKCTLNESLINAKLDKSFCFGEKQNLLMNMRTIYQNISYIINGTTIIDKKSSSSKGLSTGAIIGIILPCVVIIIVGLTIGFIYLTKPKMEKHIVKGSSEAFDSGIQMNNE